MFHYYLRAFVLALFALLALASHSVNAQTSATGEHQWLVQLSPYTHHYHSSPDHKNVYLVGVERYNANSRFWGGDNSLWGASYFSNSFGQPSGFVYYGGVFDKLLNMEKVYFKWTAGVLYGYRPPYENKVPYNHNGWSPGIVFGLGYKLTPQFSAQLNALGNAGAMITFSYQLK